MLSKKHVIILFLATSAIFPIILLNFARSISTENLHRENYFHNKVTETKQFSSFSFKAIPGKLNYLYQLSGAVPFVTCPTKEDASVDPITVATMSTLIREEIAGPVETSILLELSPYVIDHTRKMFNRDIITMENWFVPYAIHPSCLPVKNRLYCVVRIWFHLDRYEFFRNRFHDSFLYIVELDEDLKFVRNSGRLVGIPSPANEMWFTGPEDPRIIAINGSLYINIVNGQIYDGVERTVRRQFLWSVAENIVHDIAVEDYRMNAVEKNWPPLVINGTSLYFIYQIMPLTRILHCSFKYEESMNRVYLSCSFTVGKPNDYDDTVKTGHMLLRGGSPFVHYRDDYYIGATHSVQWLNNTQIYTAQIVLLNVRTSIVAFVSSPIFINPTKMSKLKRMILDRSKIFRPFFYPRSIFVEESGDSLIIAGGINDAEAVLIRLKGIAPILGRAIQIDKSSSQTPCHLLGTSQYEMMLFSAYSSTENWLRERNLKETDKFQSNFI